MRNNSWLVVFQITGAHLSQEFSFCGLQIKPDKHNGKRKKINRARLVSNLRLPQPNTSGFPGKFSHIFSAQASCCDLDGQAMKWRIVLITATIAASFFWIHPPSVSSAHAKNATATNTGSPVQDDG